MRAKQIGCSHNQPSHANGAEGRVRHNYGCVESHYLLPSYFFRKNMIFVTILKIARLQGALDRNESKIVNASLSFLVVAIPLCKRLLCSQESYVVYSPL